VERERERMAFIASTWWDLTATTDQGFSARLISVDGKRLATTNDFDSNGALKEKNASQILLLGESEATKLSNSLTG
jgi:DNA topoisomerase-1